jgi:hypothetical protein
MSDETTQTPAPVIDPVAEARKIMAAQTAGPDELGSLRKQIKALWAAVIVTFVLVVVIGISSFVPRMFGVGRGNLGNGNFRPGMQQDQGPGQGQDAGQPGQP